jgi:UDP-N-acetylglucosamine acyltransferase
MSSSVHSTAIIDKRAELARDVHIGPYCVIEGRVEIGAGTVVQAHSILRGHTRIGARCRIGPAAYVGLDGQHLKFDPFKGDTSLMIGDDTIIRETATLHRSITPGIEHATRVGDRCFIMANAHVGHDAQVGDDVIMANAVLLGGHVTIGDRAFLGGGSEFHQFVRVGRLAIVRGGETVTRDVPPFAAAIYGGLKGYNAVGCRRAALSRQAISAIREAYQCLHTHRSRPAVLDAIKALKIDAPEVRELVEFLQTTKRGIMPSVHFLDRTAEEEDE